MKIGNFAIGETISTSGFADCLLQTKYSEIEDHFLSRS
jgi:hypothetical protein